MQSVTNVTLVFCMPSSRYILYTYIQLAGHESIPAIQLCFIMSVSLFVCSILSLLVHFLHFNSELATPQDPHNGRLPDFTKIHSNEEISCFAKLYSGVCSSCLAQTVNTKAIFFVLCAVLTEYRVGVHNARVSCVTIPLMKLASCFWQWQGQDVRHMQGPPLRSPV